MDRCPVSAPSFIGSSTRGLVRVERVDTRTLAIKAMQQSVSFATNLTHTSLEHCFEVLSEHPLYGLGVQSVQLSLKNVVDAGRKHEVQVPDLAQVPLQEHQAEYNAFMTWFVFLRACFGMYVSITITALRLWESHGKFQVRVAMKDHSRGCETSCS